MKGQLTFGNLFILLSTFIAYFAIGIPVLTPFIEPAVNALPDNEFKQPTAMIIYAVPLVLLMGLVITGINYANPHREGLQYGGY